MFGPILEMFNKQQEVVNILTGQNQDEQHRDPQQCSVIDPVLLFIRQLSELVSDRPSILNNPDFVFCFSSNDRHGLETIFRLLPESCRSNSSSTTVVMSSAEIYRFLQDIFVTQYLPAEREREREEMLAAGRAAIAFINKHAVRIDKFLDSLDKGDK